MHDLKEGGVRERELFLSFRSLPSQFDFSLFLSPETPDTQARASITKKIRRGEGDNISYYPPPKKRLKIDGLIRPTCLIQSMHGT